MLPLQARVDLGVIEMKGYIPQSSSIAGTSPSDCLVSYPGHSFEGSYPSAEKQLVYSTAPADWAIRTKRNDISDVESTMNVLEYKIQKHRENMYNKKKLAI